MRNVAVVVSTLFSVMLPTAIGFADDEYHVVEIPAAAQGGMPLGVTFTLWIPNNVETVRGIIVHQHGCGVGACQGGETAAYDLHWQALARRWNCALMGPSYHQAADQECQLWCDPRNGSGEVFLQALAQLAKQTDRPEIEHVPWCLWGHSGGGFWASLMQHQHPRRIVAIWFQSGTAYSRWKSGEISAPTFSDAAMKIPMMVNAGLKERDHPRFKSAWAGSLAMVRDYRSRGAPIAFAPDPYSEHETRDARYLAIPFFDACLQQRLPGRVGEGLLEMNDDRAWLAPLPTEPNAPNAPHVAPVPRADYAGHAHSAAWLPDRSVAAKWHEFVQTGTVTDTTPPPAPTHVTTRDINNSVEISWQARADFEGGIRAFEIHRDDKLVGRVPQDASSRDGLPLFQRMSYHDTPKQPLPQMTLLDPNPTESRRYTVTTINTAGLKSNATPGNVFRDLVFAEVDGRRLTLDVYLPNQPNSEPPPLVVWIHGGGWRRGSKHKLLIRDLLDEGYALASLSYRFTPEAIFPAQLHDCKAGIRWLRAHAQQLGYDGDWIAVAGSSAGGHLALLCGLTSQTEELEGRIGSHFDESPRVQAIVDYYGPTDFVLRGETRPERAYTEKSGSFALLGGLRNGKVTRDMEQFASPVSYVTRNAPPLLIFHGTEDEVVLIDQSHRIVEKYNETGLESQLIVLPGAGHGGSKFFTHEHLRTLTSFLNRHRSTPSD